MGHMIRVNTSVVLLITVLTNLVAKYRVITVPVPARVIRRLLILICSIL